MLPHSKPVVPAAPTSQQLTLPAPPDEPPQHIVALLAPMPSIQPLPALVIALMPLPQILHSSVDAALLDLRSSSLAVLAIDHLIRAIKQTLFVPLWALTCLPSGATHVAELVVADAAVYLVSLRPANHVGGKGGLLTSCGYTQESTRPSVYTYTSATLLWSRAH